MDFPKLSPTTLLTRLQPPTETIDLILDTDTYNEIDDQFAVVYAILSAPRINLLAIHAAPFHNKRSTGPADGMQKSYEEIFRVLQRLGRPSDGIAFKGSDRYLPAADRPVESDAARDLVRRAMERSPSDPPLYVAAVGAITNVASAILMEPRIIERIVVVWLGGQPHTWHSAKEFNLQQDLHASRLMFDSGVPFVHIPCKYAAETLRTTRAEMTQFVKGRGPIGDYLHEIYCEYVHDAPARSKVIWDISAIAWLLDANWMPTILTPSPILTDHLTWSHDPRRHLVRVAIDGKRDAIFADLFEKLAAASR